MSSKAEDNIALAFHISKKFFVGHGGNVEDSEIYSDALLGLTRASNAFKPEFNVQFSTYAWRAIRNEITRGLIKKAKYESKLEKDEEVNLFNVPKNQSEEVLNPKEIPHILKMIFKLKHNNPNKRINEKFDIKMKILMDYYVLKMPIEDISKKYNLTISVLRYRMASGIEEIKKHPSFRKIKNKFENSFVSDIIG